MIRRQLALLPSMLFLLTLTLHAQKEGRKLQGEITDTDGKPMPFVNVFTTPDGKGTTSNENGDFELHIDPAEADSLHFRYTGYHEQALPIEALEPPLRIRMEERELEMATTTVKGDRDPAQRIMDSLRAHRDEYLKELGGFGAEFYMKGKAELIGINDDSPISVAVGGSDVDTSGTIYLTESMTRFKLIPPDRIEEKMISSRVAGNPRSFSSNRAEDLIKNPYKNRIQLPGISKRGFVSPIGRSSDGYYDYALTGTYHENGKTISQITLTPKRSRDPVFSGILEVVEGDWRLKALDLKVGHEAPTEFVDSLRIKQEFVDWQDREWLPLSLEEEYWFNFMGIQAYYSSAGHSSEHHALAKEEEEERSRMRFSVEDSARVRDSSYWETVRPYLLEEEERSHYQEADSMHQVRNSRPYRDSVDSVRNRVELTDLLMGGYSNHDSFDSTYWGVNSLLSMPAFNTVEGWVLRFNPYHVNYYEGGRYSRIGMKARYGFASETPYLSGSYRVRSSPLHSESWRVAGGITVMEINDEEPVPSWINSIYSLTRERNFLKLYESRFLKGSYRREWSNGFYGKFGMAWEDRRVPSNRSKQTWFPRSGEEYSPNRFHPYLEGPSKLLQASFDWTLRPFQEYELYPDRKSVTEQPWPEFYGRIEAGIPVGDEYAEYGRAELGIGDYFDLGLFGRTRVDLEGGAFLFQGERLAIMDRKHFRGNRSLWLTGADEGTGNSAWGSDRLRTYHTLDYYDWSTRRSYGSLRLHHRLQGWLLNKVPLLRKTNWHTLLGGNLLYSDERKESFGEFYVGIENIFKVIRVDLAFQGLPEFDPKPYWRVAITSDLF